MERFFFNLCSAVLIRQCHQININSLESHLEEAYSRPLFLQPTFQMLCKTSLIIQASMKAVISVRIHSAKVAC